MSIEMNITTKGKNLILKTKIAEGNNMRLLDGLPGFHKWQGREMLARPTGANIEYIVEHWTDAIWDETAAPYKEEFLQLQAESDTTKEQKQDIEDAEDSEQYVYGRKPLEHQRKAFMLSRNKRAFGLFMEQGTGKTKVCIDTACYLYRKGLIDMMVVIAWPNGVHANWVDEELPKDLPEWCKAKSVAWSSNLTKTKQRAITEVLDSKGCLKIMTFNIEAVSSSSKVKYYLERCLDENRCLTIIDQSACIKNHDLRNCKRSKYIIKTVAPKSEYRRILDGQPVAEGAGELFNQFRFLDSNIIGHDTWTAFAAEYCKLVPAPYGYGSKIDGYRNLDKLHSKIDGFSFRCLAEECDDLPPRVYKTWAFDLNAQERRIFDELKKKDLAYFEEGEQGAKMEESLAMVKNTRLQQISSGWFPLEDEWKAISDSSRLAAFKMLISSLDGKALVFARFRKDIERIEKMFPDTSVSYHGGVSDDNKARAKKEFRENDKIKLFIGQPKSAGIGHTLTAAKHVVFYNNDASLRLREECEKRAHRHGIRDTLGADGKLMIWDLVAKNTQDRAIIRALKRKKKISEEILQDPNSFFMEE